MRLSRFDNETTILSVKAYLSYMILIAASSHVVLAVYFLIVGPKIVVWISIAEMLFWVFAFYLNKIGKLKLASIMCVLKIALFSLTGAFMFGLNVNIQWIIVAAMLPTMLYLNFSTKEKIILMTIMLLTVNLKFFPGVFQQPLFPQDDSIFLAIFFANVVVFAVVLELSLHTVIRYQVEQSRHKEIEQFKSMSYDDPLTELRNRRYADIYFNKMQESGEVYSIALIDIDDFKKVNDTYGHDTGDIVLVKLAEILSENTRRAADLACRWGGEEFLLVLSGCDLDSCRTVVENIRKIVEKTTITAGSDEIKITITIGIADNIAACDKNLYEGKRSGKNKVVG